MVGPYKQEHNTRTDYIKFIPHAAEHKQTLIWLHGLGDSAHGFADVFVDPRLDFVPSTCKVVLPTAPVRAVTCNGGMKMTSWYDITSLDRPASMSKNDMRNLMSQDEIRDSVRIVTALIDQEV